MKQLFETPEVKVINLTVEDIIATSGEDNTGSFDGEWVTIGG